MSLQPGIRLGDYEILGVLGAGGMGVVYRARDLKLGREIAIKVLPEEFARDPARVSRFEREARMLAAVNHPTIAAIYGAEQDGDTRYIVMELVEGDTLGERLTRGPLAVADALRVSAGIAEALEVAHEKGVIHRDLKPANIKLTPEGRVKVLDFGLAKAMDRPFAGDMSRSPTIVMNDSRPGDIVGTPEFMSPEQARGKETDRRTDIWAFGCILYEMLTGRRLFAGETVPDALAAILHRDPDWTALPARTPPRVRELLVLCLEKDPGRRLRDAGDARLELEAAIGGLSGAGTLDLPSRPSRWKLVLAATAAAALAFAAYRLLRPGPVPPTGGPPATRQLAVLPFRNLTNTSEGEYWGVGLADTVSARLFNVHGLQVVTPSATADAAGGDTSLAALARRLGANTILSGTLQRESGLFRITYRLLDESGMQIAANAIDGAELFDLQDRVANDVVRDLHLRRASSARTPTPSGLDAPADQERYLQALGLLQRYDRPDNVVEALGILTRLAEEKPQSALIQAALAQANLNRFRWTKDRSFADRAIAATDAARALDPHLPEVEVTVGETLLETGKAPEAVRAFQRALAARPGDGQALLGLGRAAEKAGDPAAAEAAFRKAIALQPSFGAFNQLAAHYYDLGRYGDAADAFRRAAAAVPDSSRAMSNLGGAETMRCNFPAAVAAFARALELDPRNASAASNLGMTQLWTGQASEAAASLEKASREQPENFEIWGNLGDAYRARGDEVRAAEAYARSIALARGKLGLNPNDAGAHSYVATGLARTGRAPEALAEIEKALALDQTDPAVLSDAAIVAALAGRDEDAIGWLRKAVAGGYCRQIIARQPEFARLSQNPEFRSIVAAPQEAAGS
jgi:Flp pilus assembly protein TadD/TolB-like protein